MTPAPSPRPLTEEEHRAITLRSMSVAPGWAKLANTHADRKRLLEAMDYWRQRAEKAEAERNRMRASLSSAHGALHALLKTPCPRKCVILRAMALPPAPSGGPSP